MIRHLTQDELDRIEEFAQTATYLREPDMLLPNEEDSADMSGERG